MQIWAGHMIIHMGIRLVTKQYGINTFLTVHQNFRFMKFSTTVKPCVKILRDSIILLDVTIL